MSTLDSNSSLVVSVDPRRDFGADFVNQLQTKLNEALGNSNVSHHENYLHVAVAKHNENGRLTAGLYGFGQEAWFNIHLLWVDKPLQGKGIGASLVRAAEQEVMKRNYAGISVLTLDARPFYERLGYTTQAEMPNRPPPKTCYMLTKILDHNS